MTMKQLIIFSFNAQLLKSHGGSSGSVLELLTHLEIFINIKFGLPSGFLVVVLFILVDVQLFVGQSGSTGIELVLTKKKTPQNPM